MLRSKDSPHLPEFLLRNIKVECRVNIAISAKHMSTACITLKSIVEFKKHFVFLNHVNIHYNLTLTYDSCLKSEAFVWYWTENNKNWGNLSDGTYLYKGGFTVTYNNDLFCCRFRLSYVSCLKSTTRRDDKRMWRLIVITFTWRYTADTFSRTFAATPLYRNTVYSRLSMSIKGRRGINNQKTQIIHFGWGQVTMVAAENAARKYTHGVRFIQLHRKPYDIQKSLLDTNHISFLFGKNFCSDKYLANYAPDMNTNLCRSTCKVVVKIVRS
jgi:hypothetical protein